MFHKRDELKITQEHFIPIPYTMSTYFMDNTNNFML